MKKLKKIDVLLNAARSCIDSEDWPEALALMLKAKPLDKENYSLLFQIGWAYMKLGQPSQALNYFEQVEGIASKNSVVLNSVGMAYMQLHLWPAALRALLQSMKLDEANVGTHLNLAKVYYNIQEHKNSLNISMKAISLDVANVRAHQNIGAALLALGFLKEARLAFETSIILDPEALNSIFNLAMISSQDGNSSKAIEEYRHYLSKAEPLGDENVNVANYYLGLELLKVGQLKEGWKLYEGGFDPAVPAYAARSPARRFLKPRWKGQPIPGQRLLVWAEQGIGDEILFLSCLNDLVETDVEVILECAPRLIEVMSRSFPSVKVRASAYDENNFKASIFNDFDFQIPLGSLMGIYRQDLKEFDRSLPYVIVDKNKKERFSDRLAGFEGKIKVGICWRSGLLNPTRNKFYTAINDWGELLKLNDFVFVNLQYGDCEAEILEAEGRFGISILRWGDLDLKNDIDETFALIDCLDIVVTTGTAVHSMAGSLGKPTLMLIPHWGYGNFGTDHYPWHPHTRCFVPPRGKIIADVLPDVVDAISKISC